MKKRLILFVLFCATNFALSQTVDESALRTRILENDSLLFNVGFNKCVLSVFDSLLTADFEFYHDKTGFSDKEQFIAGLRKGLFLDTTAYKSRRELQPESSIVTALYNHETIYGAIQEGTHLFYERISGGKEKYAGSARFTHIWLLQNDQWKLARSLSFQHHSAKEETSRFELSNADLYQIATTVLEDRNNYPIWNLMEIDTNKRLITTGHFTDEHSDKTLVLLQGVAGASSGTADNLLLLLDVQSAEKQTVVWAKQAGDFSMTDIRDLTNDGIPEIVIQSGYTWMGEAGDHYEIINFKNGSENTLFSATSHTISDWDDGLVVSHFKKGDTLEVQFDCTLIQQANKTVVQRKETICIHDGGKSVASIRRKMKVISRISEFPLN